MLDTLHAPPPLNPHPVSLASRPPGRSSNAVVLEARRAGPSILNLSLSLPRLPHEIFTPLNVYPVESFFYSTGAFAFIQLGRSIFHRGGISRSEPTAGGIPPGSSSLIIAPQARPPRLSARPPRLKPCDGGQAERSSRPLGRSSTQFSSLIIAPQVLYAPDR